MTFRDKVVTTATGEWLSPATVRHRVAVRGRGPRSSCSVVVINPDDEANVWVEWQVALDNQQVPFVGPVPFAGECCGSGCPDGHDPTGDGSSS